MSINTAEKNLEKILFVDDEESILAIAREFFRQKGYQVVTAKNGLEAIDMLKENTIDCCITDINMPEMDGLEVCRTIRKDPNLSSVKVMIITGHPNDSKLKQVAELGFNHIYTKPLSSADFLKEVDNILLQPTRVMI